MGRRTLSSPGQAYSRVRHVRLRLVEDDALQQMAEASGQTPSQVIRQLIRIAATGAPDFVGDHKIDLRMLAHQVASIGRNLNQLVRSINRGDQVAPDELRRVLNATRVQFTVVYETYMEAVRTASRRLVVPLCEAAGLRSPFEIETTDPPARAADERGPAGGGDG